MTNLEMHAFANTVACPFCSSARGQYCKGRSRGRQLSNTPHMRRLTLARAERVRQEKEAAAAAAESPATVADALAQLQAEVRALRNEVRAIRRAIK